MVHVRIEAFVNNLHAILRLVYFMVCQYVITLVFLVFFVLFSEMCKIYKYTYMVSLIAIDVDVDHRTGCTCFVHCY